MAEEKNVNNATEDVRLDKKVTVRSIAPWDTGTARKTSIGDITISPMGTVLVSREELIAQGFMCVRGKVNRKYIEKKFYGFEYATDNADK